jgi:DNA-binding IscR family transcriptional regulator
LQCSVSGEGESGNAVRQAWERVSSALCHELDQITVASLASDPGGAMFYI